MKINGPKIYFIYFVTQNLVDIFVQDLVVYLYFERIACKRILPMIKDHEAR